MRRYLFILSYISFALWSCVSKGEPEIFIVPKDYIGYLIVVFNQASGYPIRYDGKKRVYEMPENGILKTQFQPTYGWTSSIEFFYDTISSNTKIPTIMDYHKIPNDIIAGWTGSSGSMKKNESSNDRLKYRKSYIGTKTDILQAIEQSDTVDLAKIGEF